MTIEDVCMENGIYGKKAELFKMISEQSPISCPKRVLAERFGVSEMTIFRYLKELSDKGLISSYGDGGGVRTYIATVELDGYHDTVISSLKAEIDALRGVVAELIDHINTITDHNKNHNTTVTDHNKSPRARVIINNIKKNEEVKDIKNTVPVYKMETETEAERACEDHNIEDDSRELELKVAFDMIWDSMDWLQKMRYRQTKEIQWKYSRNALDKILGKITVDTLMKRIKIAVGDRFAFNKTVSYWLKDNIDMLTASEYEDDIVWKDLNPHGDSRDGDWSFIARAVGA